VIKIGVTLTDSAPKPQFNPTADHRRAVVVFDERTFGDFAMTRWANFRRACDPVCAIEG